MKFLIDELGTTISEYVGAVLILAILKFFYWDVGSGQYLIGRLVYQWLFASGSFS